MNDIHDVIDAFADGEPVDPARLTAALAEPAGREYSIDLLALRSLVGNDAGGRFAPARSDAGETTPGVVSDENRRPASVFRARRLLATAALVTVGVLGGFIAGQRLAGARPAAPAAAASTNTAPQIVPVSAPSPTRVIRLENGVDWNERGGGN